MEHDKFSQDSGHQQKFLDYVQNILNLNFNFLAQKRLGTKMGFAGAPDPLGEF